jgi:hypothetical protein
MKLLLYLLAVTILSLGDGLAADQPLTADELAFHLGVHAWETTVARPPGSFQITVMHLIDGKPADSLLVGFQGKDDAQGTRLVVIAGPSPTGTKVTIQLGSAGAAMNPKEQTADIFCQSVERLPKQIDVGTYLLGGEYQAGEKVTNITGKIDDVKNGLLLEVTAR